MSGLPFEARGYWLLEEVLDATSVSPRERRRIRRWLAAAECTAETPTGGKVVTRIGLEKNLPWLLETLRRVAQRREHQTTLGDTGRHAEHRPVSNKRE